MKIYKGWTVFYWAWWISWAPFVGMFIARISKGRTIREFMAAVLLVPTVVTIIWMTAFGAMPCIRFRTVLVSCRKKAWVKCLWPCSRCWKTFP